ncbi:MAG: DEAD/DEAH box helicase [Alphaproteobacteria bacterium]
MTNPNLPETTINLSQSGASKKSDELGMREMQARAYAKRGYQYLLIKSPPASGKSRALMFVALDKLHNQGVKKAIIVVPERSIGGSFSNTPLTDFGFYYDFEVEPQWNLCNAPNADEKRANPSTIKALGEFLQSDDRILICTHATFRFAFEEIGIDAFDDCLLAIDEFHHVSMSEDNVLGRHLADIITRDKVHVVAMTGSYFRGDAVPVLSPDDEEKFETVTYTYYEQLNGYDYLKSLSLGYYFYSGRYLSAISEVLDPNKKTIIHIPNVNARESTKDKIKEAEDIMVSLGTWKYKDPDTGFHIIETPEGKTLKVADLVEDEKSREQVMSSLKDERANADRDWVDIIIALGMAKEGFDWIWCEHALTVGYRSSLTEIVQIIGRATRDAPHKTSAKFTNLIAEPDASEGAVTDAINDTLKAIAASLLMEQVLIPNFKFTPKRLPDNPQDGFEYGEGGYDNGKTNVGVNEAQTEFHIEIKDLKEPTTPEGKRVCDEDIKELVAAVLQDKTTVEQGLFNEDAIPEETTVVRTMNIVRKRYPNLPDEDQEAARQRVVAAMNMIEMAGKGVEALEKDGVDVKANTALLQGIRRFATDVRDLDVDLIDSINPFQSAYSILSKTMDEKTLKQLKSVISGKKLSIPYEEARELAVRALKFKNERGVAPSPTAADPWERRMADGIAALARHNAKKKTT